MNPNMLKLFIEDTMREHLLLLLSIADIGLNCRVSSIKV